MRTDNWLSKAAATTPERLALVAGGERITFAELEARSLGAASRLAGLGAGPGSRVGLTLEAGAEYVVLLHALAKLGAVAVPLNPRLEAGELERRLDGAGATLSISDPAQLAEAPQREVSQATSLDLDAPSCVIHTSGTSGRARTVELTWGNHLWSALASAARIGVDPGDRWLCSLPLHHIGGLAIVLRGAVYGTATVLERFDAARVREMMNAGEVTVASLVGTTLARLLDAGADLARLRCALVGGGPVAGDVLGRALDAGAPLAPTYGLTEAASQVTTLPPGEARRRPGSAGTPLLPTEVRIDGDGVILVRGPTVSAACAGEGGWLRTGDRGRLGEDGHLHVEGRADDVIVTGGENVSPEAVERALLQHPAVDDAAVIGAEDSEWQQAVTALVVVRDGTAADEGELRDFCRGRLAPHEVPKRIAFVDRLPRDPQGKLRRRELRASGSGSG